jgi:HAE1 family hydrophobic/amphiphilic exporter-1
MVTGLAGIMFKQLGWIVTIIISVSTLAALSLTPMLSSKLLKKDPKRSKAFSTIYAPIEKGLDALDRGYASLLAIAIKHRAIVIFAAFLIFAGSLLLLSKVGTDFFPASDNAQIGLTIELPVGTRVEQARKLDKYLYDLWKDKYPEVEIFQSSLGQSDGSNIFMSMRSSGTHLISYTARLSKATKRKRDIFEISDEMRKDLAAIPEIYRFQVMPGGNSGMGFGSGGTTLDMDVF